MRQRLYLYVILLLAVTLCGCAALAIMGGMGIGAVGTYAVGRDTIQTDTEKPMEMLWEAALAVARDYGAVTKEDMPRGILDLRIGPNKAWVRIIRMTRTINRLKVSARAYHLPNIALAQDIFIKIMEKTQ